MVFRQNNRKIFPLGEKYCIIFITINEYSWDRFVLLFRIKAVFFENGTTPKGVSEKKRYN